MSLAMTLHDRAMEFQDLLDREFRDANGLPVMAIHENGRPLTEDDIRETDYHRPPYAGRGRALLWHLYENVNGLMGHYVAAQAARVRAGDPAGLRSGKAMIDLLLEIYFEHSRHIEPGLIGKPIVEPGSLAAYDTATETNADQMQGIFRGIHDFRPMAAYRQRRHLEQMATEIIDYSRRRNYALEARGRTIQGMRGIHAQTPMMFLLVANQFAPGEGYYDEYETWIELARQDVKVNATAQTYLNYMSVTGQLDGDNETYCQGVWTDTIDTVALLAELDPRRRWLYLTRLGEWWEETEPLLTDDGRVTWSMMVTPETRVWRPMRPGEITRGPYSCWWGAPVLFSGQVAAPAVAHIAEACPALRERAVAWLHRLLEATTRERLHWCWAMPGCELPENLDALSHELYSPCAWLHAYWRARAAGFVDAP